jgi:anti-sigma regulatory factor (Ser/Thr protein kinase)
VTVTPARSNVVQVERLLSALGAGDDATVLGLVDPSIELVPLIVSAGLVPDAYRGLDGLRAYLDDADAVEVERGFVVTRMSGAQDVVVAFGDLPIAPDATTPGLWVWRLRDGLATHGMMVADEDALRAARDAGEEIIRPRAPLRLVLPALPESAGDARQAVSIWAHNVRLSVQERNDLLLAVSEAVTNVIRHAHPAGPGDAAFRLSAEVGSERVQVVVTDDGVGLGAGSPNPGLGMGLPLLGTLTDALTLVSPPERPRGLEVRMWFAFATLTA